MSASRNQLLRVSFIASGILLALAGVLAAGTSAVPAVAMPAAGAEPPSAVPMDVVKTAASIKAKAVLGDTTSLGTVVPLVDIDGRTAAYAFNYRTDGSPFPSYQEAVSDVLAERQLSVDLERARHEGEESGATGRNGKPLRIRPRVEVTSKYGWIIVSARYDRLPILGHGKGLSEYYTRAGKAVEAVQAAFPGSPVRLHHIYYLFPAARWLEFEVGGGRFIVDIHGPGSVSDADSTLASLREKRDAHEGQALARLREQGADVDELEAEAEARSRQAWDDLLTKGVPEASADALVPGYGLVPYYDWHKGCSPTSAAMILGFYDEVDWYGRLVDWHMQEWDAVQVETDYNVPVHTINELVQGMGTDPGGGTSPGAVGTGIIAVTNSGANAYSFTLVDVDGNILNNWAWATVVAEIDAGYPCVWSASWLAHSTACVGYDAGAQEVIVHNTWWMGLDYFAYTDGGLLSYTCVDSPHEGGPVYYDVDILEPYGDPGYNHDGNGEVWYAGSRQMIRWENFGRPGDGVDIWFSDSGGDGGWHLLSSAEADDGEYEWLIDCSYVTTQGRVSIDQGYGGVYVAGDGSWGNFIVQADTTNPNTTVTSCPSGSCSGTVTITYGGSDNASSQIDLEYSYRLDGGSWSAWTPSTSKTYSGLSQGPHTFEVRATDVCGNIDPSPASCTFTVTSPPTADFSGSPRSGCAPLTVCFNDLSTGSPTSWSWSFGDGGSSSLPSPCHTYASPGTYTVSLTVSNACGSDTETKSGYIVVLPMGPEAEFTGSPTAASCPATVSFQDLSTGDPTSWLWDFGDGGTSTEQNPAHTYECEGCGGCHTVCLTVANACGQNTECKVDYICVEPPPTAAFTFEQTTPCPAPVEVCFTDLSACAAGWEWDFGDGHASTEQNPCHTYEAAGTYQVCLTVLNAWGLDTACANVEICPGCNKTISTPDVVGAGTAEVPVMVNDPSGIMGFDITLTYCSEWMSVTDVAAGDCLDASWVTDWTVPAPGQVRVIGFSMSPLATVDPCSLFDVTFAIDCLEPGSVCPLDLVSVGVSDSAGNPIPGVCLEPGTVTCGFHHLHYYFVAECFPLGAGTECPLGVPVRIEAHASEDCTSIAAVDLPVELSTTCGMAVDPPVANLAGGVWEGPIGMLAPHDDPLCGVCALRGTVVGFGQWDSGSFSPRAKGDVDGDCTIRIFDVLRAVNLMLGTPVPTPCEEYQAWAADTDCELGHPCGNGVVEIFDLLRIIRYMLDGVWPCLAASPAADRSPAAPVELSLGAEQVGDEVVVAVRAGEAAGLAGLDLTLTWRTGNLRFLSAEPGSLTADRWLVQAVPQGRKAVRILALATTGAGLAETEGEVVLLRFAVKGNADQAIRGLGITSATLSDAAGEAMPGGVR